MKRLLVALIASALSVTLGLTAIACSSATSPATVAISLDTAPSLPTTAQTTAPAGYITVDVNTAYEGLSVMNEGKPQIVDVREPSEWAATGVPVGAILIPLGELKERATGELAKDKPVYVICNSGNRSRTGAQILVDLGYMEVYNVDGGIQAWLAAALPVEFRP